MKQVKLKIIKRGKKGTYCLRCGMDKKEIQKETSNGCNAWGSYYFRHCYK